MSKIKKNKRFPLSSAVLESLSLLGTVYKASLPSQILSNLKKYTDKKYGEEKIESILDRLRKNGYISFCSSSNTTIITLTNRGARRLASHKAQKHKIPNKQKRWDKKWRIVIFDIKEDYRNIRDKLRIELREIGFVMLQNSVWVYPHDCQEYITLLKLDERIARSVIYIVAGYIEQDKLLKKHFKLK